MNIHFLILWISSVINGQSINLQIQCGQLKDARECLSVKENQTETDGKIMFSISEKLSSFFCAGPYCPTTFHSYFCSPKTPFDQDATIKCPFYLLKLIDEFQVRVSIFFVDFESLLD